MTTEQIWLGIGFFGQALFFMRFLVQSIASEKLKRSVVPDLFWYFSMGGGSFLLLYSLYRMDPVFISGQGLGLIIYARNIHFIRENKKRETDLENNETL